MTLEPLHVLIRDRVQSLAPEAAGSPTTQSLLDRYVAGPGELSAFLGPGPVLTDDRPMLEYYLSLTSDSPPVDLRQLRRR